MIIHTDRRNILPLLEEYTKLAPGDYEGHAQLGASYEIISERSLDDAITHRTVELIDLLQ